jgi:hypothetical protein
MTHLYITDRSGFGAFPLRVLERYDSREAMVARLAEIAAVRDDYDGELNFLSSATHVASSELKISVGKCLPMDRTKASDIRTGAASAEALPVVRAFAARIDRLREEDFQEMTPELQDEARRAMAEIDEEEAAARRGRRRHGWR